MNVFDAWLRIHDKKFKSCRQEKFRAIGVSNYEEHHLAELMDYATIPPVVNQFEVHPQRPAKSLRQACNLAGESFK